MTQTPPEPQLPPPPGYAQPPAYPQPPAYGPATGYAQPPAYPQPPAYIPPAGDAMPAQMHYAAAPDSRNVLGILALIAPFVGLSMVGIVLGHLGLGAVKKGTANNRGIALAGTIVSWVFTLFVALGIVASIAIPVFLNQRNTAHEAAVKSDLMTLRMAVESSYVDNLQVPTVAYAGGNYYVGNEIIGADSTVTDARLFSDDGQSYCIEVEFRAGLVRSVDNGGYLGYGC